MITLAFSPCPNDTFVFYALVHGKVDTEGLEFEYRTDDVETLNHDAMAGTTDMIKVSYHAWLYLRDRYELLESGSALGTGNGPLVISRDEYGIEDLPRLTVAIPGEYTTAHLLLKLAAPGIRRKKILVFSEIEDALLKGDVDAGVIIHESRFTYTRKGLRKIADLGEFWEDLTHAPIPLGGIVARKSLGPETLGKMNRSLRRSVEYAFAHPEETMSFVREHAQEMEDDIMQKHIRLYVNDFTIHLGESGHRAVDRLVELFHRTNPMDR